MSFGDATRTCINKFATFDGRASRSEFWWFYLFTVMVYFIGLIPLVGLLIIGGVSDGGVISGALSVLMVILGIIWLIAVVALYIPLLAVGSRRLHDRGQSGWLQLLLLVPCGNIVLYVFWALEGTPGENAYGPRTN